MIPNVEEQLLKSLTEGITHLSKIHFYFVNYCRHMIFSFTEKLTKLVKPKINRDTYFALCWKENQVQGNFNTRFHSGF